MSVSHFKSSAGFSEAIALIFEGIIQYNLHSVKSIYGIDCHKLSKIKVMMIDGVKKSNS